MALLTPQEVRQVVDALVTGGIDPALRGVLFQFIDPRYKAALPTGLPPVAQFMADIGHMNTVERLANGDIPLMIYLENAAVLLAGSPNEQKIIRFTLDLIGHRITGAPRINPVDIPETQELIIHSDDTLPAVFMEAGVKASIAVAKLRVPAFENGQPKLLPSNAQVIGTGTGWLLTSSLIMTNHHVVNARKEGEPDATDADLLLQGKNIISIFDFDDENQAGTEIASTVLEAWNKELDYAVLRLPDTGRAPLRRAAAKIASAKNPIPVNIIQHPGGRSKRFAIRNNLVSASTDTHLRYFTDTEGGSSGSPVLNDKWETVALHRGSTYVDNVQFQGKTTAYVNVGTHLTSILDDLRNRFAALAAEIGI